MTRAFVYAIEKCKELRGLSDQSLADAIVAKPGPTPDADKHLNRGTLSKMYAWDGGERSPTLGKMQVIARGLADNFDLDDPKNSERLFREALNEGLALFWYAPGKPPQTRA